MNSPVKSEDAAPLLARKAELVDMKRQEEQSLFVLKNMVRTGRLTPAKYNEVCASQFKHMKQVRIIEKELGEIKAKLNAMVLLERAQLETVYDNLTAPPNETLQAIVDLRNQYQAFSADVTRIASMRTMAADFAIKLAAVIRNATSAQKKE